MQNWLKGWFSQVENVGKDMTHTLRGQHGKAWGYDGWKMRSGAPSSQIPMILYQKGLADARSRCS